MLWHDGAKWRFQISTPAGGKSGWRPTRTWAKHAAQRRVHDLVVPCVACGKLIDPQARRCMHCGAWSVTEPTDRPAGEPMAVSDVPQMSDVHQVAEPQGREDAETAADAAEPENPPEGEPETDVPHGGPGALSMTSRMLLTVLLASIVVTAALLLFALTR